jgi:hypothetical protein
MEMTLRLWPRDGSRATGQVATPGVVKIVAAQSLQ